MKRILAIDYGLKRIGIAMTSEAGDFALPLSVIENTEKTVDEIVVLCQKHDVGTIVIGESKDFAQKDNTIMADVRVFAEKLHTQSGLPVVFHPEFMTSQQAERLQGKNDMLDASAATIILQDYLATNNLEELR